MKVAIITCFESNEERAKMVYEVCKSREYEVSMYTTDFSHMKKSTRNNVPDVFTAIKTKLYKKNLSIQRMYSHSEFSKDVFKRIENNKPDLIWLIVPANSLLKEARLYKHKNPSVKIIVDVIDMWPESLPLHLNKHAFPFSVWRNIRKNNISCADLLVTECDYYQDILTKEYKGEIETLYWAREGKAIHNVFSRNDDVLSLCYIGSINNIIDIEKTKNVVSKISKPVELHIIGEGEKTDLFVDEMKQCCSVMYHGVIRDEEKKKEIFDKCHAGINLYKEGLYIGFTTKCIDYFKNGLPIVNNIKGDTWKMVEDYDAGINVNNNVVDAELLIEQRNNNEKIIDLYNNSFSSDAFKTKCNTILDEVIK